MNATVGQPQNKNVRQERLRRRTLGGYRYVRMRWRLLFAAIDLAGTLAFTTIRFLFAWLPQRRSASDPQRILLVQFDHLGDAVITTAMFEPLQQKFPNARIDVLAAPWNRAVFGRLPQVDRVDVCPHNRFAEGARFSWIPATIAWGLRLRKRRYDLAIDVRGEFPHNVLLWLTGAPQRLGWASGGGGFLLTDTPEFVVDRPELESREALLACLGIRCETPLQPQWPPSPGAVRTARTAWDDLGAGKLRVVLHVGAGTSAKRWPVEYWRRLAERLSLEGNIATALVGTAGDTQTARAILGSKLLDVPDWTGRYSIDELAAVVQEADVLVGGDSGPAHLAAAVGTAVVVLFSGTNTVRQWQPRGPNVRALRHGVQCSPCHLKACPVAGHPCMRGIQPDEVLRQILQLLPQSHDKNRAAVSSMSTKGLHL